jgi:hypothetical protein
MCKVRKNTWFFEFINRITQKLSTGSVDMCGQVNGITCKTLRNVVLITAIHLQLIGCSIYKLNKIYRGINAVHQGMDPFNKLH